MGEVTRIERTRRSFLQSGGVLAAAAVAASCAPAAPGSQPGAPAASAPVQGDQEWNDLVAAAKKEGKLSLVTTVGDSLRNGVAAFEQAFPGIAVEHTQLIASQFAPRVRQEREGSIYTYDVITTTFGTVPLKIGRAHV